MSEEPSETSKVVLQDFRNQVTLWFDSINDAAEYLTKEAIIDRDEFAVYELGKEVTFKVVPA